MHVDKYEADHILFYMDKLPPKMQQVVKLRYCEGYTRDEIAEITGTSSNTVRNNLAAGLKHLKTHCQ